MDEYEDEDEGDEAIEKRERRIHLGGVVCQ